MRSPLICCSTRILSQGTIDEVVTPKGDEKATSSATSLSVAESASGPPRKIQRTSIDVSPASATTAESACTGLGGAASITHTIAGSVVDSTADSTAKSGDNAAVEVVGGAATTRVVCSRTDASVAVVTPLYLDLNIPDDDGTTPLLESVRRNLPDLVKKLIKGGSNVNAVDKNGTTPLLESVRQKLPALVVILIDNGADVNAADAFGNTPLLESLNQLEPDDEFHRGTKLPSGVMRFLAPMVGVADITKILLKKGAVIEPRHLHRLRRYL